MGFIAHCTALQIVAVATELQSIQFYVPLMTNSTTCWMHGVQCRI